MIDRTRRKNLFFFLVFLTMFLYREKYFPGLVVPVQGADPSLFFFHSYSKVYQSENGSVFVYDGADAEPPLSTAPTTTVLKCEILQNMQYSFFSFDVHIGVVYWVTQSLLEDYALDGVVTMQVWLSSSDADASGTGYGMGVADLDEKGSVIKYFYNYRYASGTILSIEPTEYSLQVMVHHVFAKDHKLVFEVAVGSTKQGWMASVHFDSVNRDYKAVLPSGPVVIPESQRDSNARFLRPDTDLCCCFATGES